MTNLEEVENILLASSPDEQEKFKIEIWPKIKIIWEENSLDICYDINRENRYLRPLKELEILAKSAVSANITTPFDVFKSGDTDSKGKLFVTDHFDSYGLKRDYYWPLCVGLALANDGVFKEEQMQRVLEKFNEVVVDSYAAENLPDNRRILKNIYVDITKLRPRLSALCKQGKITKLPSPKGSYTVTERQLDLFKFKHDVSPILVKYILDTYDPNSKFKAEERGESANDAQ